MTDNLLDEKRLIVTDKIESICLTHVSYNVDKDEPVMSRVDVEMLLATEWEELT